MIIFDLDDTLVNSHHIFEAFFSQCSVNYDIGIRTCFVSRAGRPWSEIVGCLRTVCGIGLSERIRREYEEWYDDAGYKMHTPFCGVSELLLRVSGAQGVIPVLTNKRANMAEKILLENFSGLGFEVFGADSDGNALPKHLVLGEYKPVKDSSIVYVGDTMKDFEEATEAGVGFIGGGWRVNPEVFSPGVETAERPSDLPMILKHSFGAMV